MKKEIVLIKFSCLLCATAVLIYLAVANALYGQSSTEGGDVKCQDNTRWSASATTVATKLDPRSNAASNVQPADAARISPADVYALMCERADDNKPWAEPTAIPVSRVRVEKPFNVTVK